MTIDQAEAKTVIAVARDWIAGDPDPDTQAELAALIEQGAVGELVDRMAGTLAFGTAGLRGRVQAGSNRMNRAVVIRATRGLADYLLERYGSNLPGPVVVGRDARPSSASFMDDTVGVLAAAGLPVRFWQEATATPLVAYATASLGACAAVVVTASHNPPQDNGYKVYDANGAQIIPPVDTEIATAIDKAPMASQIPRLPRHEWQESSLVSPISLQVLDEYLEAIATLRPAQAGDASLRIVYTPLHGVGWKPVQQALRLAGYQDLHPVSEQIEPNGLFPTVSFPNPEEPGALDLALSLAQEVDADLLLANDPDADRLAAAVPYQGVWKVLTGNQLGVLLADYVLSHHDRPRPMVINSIVSSPMLRAVAEGYGARMETTFTGFKWITNAAMEIEKKTGEEFVFGYEEALGYTVGRAVRDKDGIGSALTMADLASECRQQGTTVMGRLAELYRRFGLWISLQVSIVRTGPAGKAEIDAALNRLAEDKPARLGGWNVEGVIDFRVPEDSRPQWLDTAPLIAFSLEGGGRALARPSGTEPKLKMYIDLPGAVPEGANPFEMEEGLLAQAQEVSESLAGAMGFS